MADSKVDDIILEIDTEASKADEGLDKLSSALNSLKSSIEGINIGKLNSLKQALNSFKISKDTANSIQLFSDSMGKVANVTNKFSLKTANNEVGSFAKLAKDSAQEIGQIYGLPTKKVRELENAFMELGKSMGDNPTPDRMLWGQIENEVWKSRRVVDEFYKDYKSIVDRIDAANASAGRIKLDFGVADIGDDFTNLKRILGRGFTEKDNPFGGQMGFDSWLKGLDEHEIAVINSQVERMGGIVGDTSSAFRALVAIKQQYNSANKKGAVEENEFNSSLDAFGDIAANFISGWYSMKKAVGDVDFDKATQGSDFLVNTLDRVVGSLSNFTIGVETGTALKDVGQGFATVAKAVNQLKDVDSGKIKEITDAIVSVNESLTGLGSNNDIRIKIDGAGIQKVSKDIKDMSGTLGDVAIEITKTEDILDDARDKNPFSEATEGANDFVDAANKANKVLEELEKNNKKTADNMSKLGQSFAKIKEYNKTMSDMTSGKVDFDWKSYQKAAVELDKIGNFQKVMNSFATLGTPKGLEQFAGILKGVSNEMNKLANVGIKGLKVAFTPLIGVAKSFGKQASMIKDNFVKSFDKIRASLKKLSEFWKRSMRTFTFMLVRKAITAVLGDFKEAIDNLAKWSKEFGTPFNDSISSIVADFKYMGRAVLAAVEPLINAVAPIIAKLTDLFSTLAGKVAELMAAITGQSYWMKAKKNVVDYADSVKSASKEAKGALQGFDELNNITTQSDSGSGIDADAFKNDWEKMPVSEMAKDWADKIKSALSDLWYPIGEAWDKMKEYVLGGWKYMTSEMKSLLKDVWKDFIEVWKQEATIKIFESIFGIIGDIEYTIGNLVKNLHEAWNYNKTGKKILENIRDIVGTLVQHVRNVTLYMKEWSAGIDFKPLLTSFESLTKSLNKTADFIGGVFEDAMIDGVLKFIKWFTEKGIPDIFKAFTEVNESFNFDKIRADIDTVIVAIEQLAEHVVGGATIAFEHLGKKVAEWFNSDKFTKFTDSISRILGVFTEERIATVLEGIGTAFLDIAEALADIVSSDAVVGIFESIGKWIDEKGVDGIAKSIERLAAAIVALKAGSVAFAVVSAGVSAFAKIKFAWDVAKIAKDIGEFGKAAGEASETVETLSEAAEGMSKVKDIGALGNFAAGIKTAFTSTDIVASIGGAESIAAAAGTLGTTIAVAIGTAIASYFATNKVMQWIMPEDADLYKKYQIGGKGNYFKDIFNTDESLTDNLKDMLDGAISMMTDFENHPVIAALATTLAGPFGIAANIISDFKESSGIEGIKDAFESIGEKANGLKEDIGGAFTLIGEDISDAFSSIQETLSPVTEVIKHVADVIGGTFQVAVMAVKAAFILLGQAIQDALGKVSEFVKANVVEPIKAIATAINDTVIQPIKEGFAEAWSAIQATWGIVSEWFNTTVITPVKEFFTTALTEITTLFTQMWTDIQTVWGIASSWFEETVILPIVGFFDSAITSIKDAFKTLWDDVKSGVRAAFNTVVSVVGNALNGLIEGINLFIKGLNFVAPKLAAVTGDSWTDIEIFPKITIPKFSSGGFPEDGLFMANHNELIGQFNNGQTAVANNNQIIEGIAGGVDRANAQQNVLFNQMIELLGQIADKDLSIGDDAIYSSYQRGAVRYQKRYGV